jgi:predicted nucleic-acid-binding protein
MGSAALKSVDTNVVLRFLLDDDPVQSRLARAIMASHVAIPITVLLETGWVLASRYGFDRQQLAQTLRELVDRRDIHVADRLSLLDALDAFSRGGDFADAIHLFAARGTEAFVTFDNGVRSNEAIGVSVELAG